MVFVHEAYSFKKLACKGMARGHEQPGRRLSQSRFFLRGEERLYTAWELIDDRNRMVFW
jgi:hypothetical protein